MTIEDMKRRKKELGYTNKQIAVLSGVPLGTVQKIFGGSTETPRYETLRALASVLNDTTGWTHATLMRDGAASYMVKKQGEYTLEDYYNIPDEQRVELIDGVIYYMSAPTSAHQLIAGYIHAKFLNHVMDKKGKCLPMISPLDVQLDRDDKTMVQPDVVIICDRDKVIKRCVYGAPDFVLEVLSPSTRKKDMIIKLNKYLNAEVKEYWLIDPDKQRVYVYDFTQENYPVIYTFQDTVPVAVWDGECEIDFREVYEHIRFLYERD